MRDRTPLEVFLVFLKLGLTSFGGPAAHIGYFREELVVRRRWIDESTYTDLVALCQFLPGPSSSQLGFSLGIIRAGYGGGLAAWAGFTLPSAAALTALAFGVDLVTAPVGLGLLHGLKLVAVAIVAQAVWGMARAFCRDGRRAAIAASAAALILGSGAPLAPLAAIALGGLAGLLVCREVPAAPVGSVGTPVSRPAAVASLAVFAGFLVMLPVVRSLGPAPAGALVAACYRAGALVFGGGHVVLPLLREAVVPPGWVSDGTFLAGYGAAQAIPGPLFSFSAYLGAVIVPAPHRVVGAVAALIALFLPGMLLLIGALPFWDAVRSRVEAQAILRGINASVVGVLGAALYTPVWTSSIRHAADVGVAVLSFGLLTFWRAPPLLVVVLGALAGIALTLSGH